MDVKRKFHKRIVKLISFVFLFMLVLSQQAYAEDLEIFKSEEPANVTALWINNPVVLVNTKEQRLDVSPFQKDGRTMVPLRFISESLGAKVGWTESENKITVTLDGTNIDLWLGKTEAKVNNHTVKLDVPAMSSKSRTMVPLRFISENLKQKVDFNPKTNKITITANGANTQQATSYQAPEVKNESGLTVRDIVSNDNKYNGVSSQDDLSAKYSITFTNFQQNGEFKGKIEWVGFNVIDDLVGYISGDQIIFTQTARYQNNEVKQMNVKVTMEIGGNNRVSGTWKDEQTGTTGTTYFEFTPAKETPVKTAPTKTPEITYIGDFDTKGYPFGDVTVTFGNNIKFDGEVKVNANNFIAIGVVTYPDKTKVIGRFVNGKPDGMCSIMYPNKAAYLLDFNYGKPIDVYQANTIPTFKADELDVYKAHEVDVFKAEPIGSFKADNIDYFQADDIDYFQADSIEPYKADMIELYKAEQVEKISAEDIKKYEAEVAKLNPPGAHSNIGLGGFTSPDYMNPLVQAWTSHMMRLPYLMNNNMVYSN